MKQILNLLVFLLTCSISYAQLNGKVTDEMGEPLSFASVYVQGTSKGTTTNIEGNYFLELDPGTYKVIFQYVGFEQQVRTVDLKSEPLVLNIILKEQALDLQEVVVKANAEDPAYPIIRKAIAKRNYYKELVEKYSCDVYIKGVNKILNAPEKIFGVELGDLGGNLDSTGQGIIYLSESESKLFFEKPDNKKEQMISSKISGNDNGFSFNQASSMDFSFYENHIDILRNLLSPIADNALSYYKYKLEGTFFDESGRLINKIRVIPKRAEDPTFGGFIYIVDELWNIQSTELIVTGKTIKQPILDTLIIKQVHVPVAEPDTWMLLSQSLDFKFGLLGFQVDGNFTGVFSNYNLNPQFEPGFFSNEIFKVEEGANEKSLSYWDSIRPVPLTLEESNDYIKKDSLQRIWESKTYRDSMDRKNNKFKIWDLLFGYQYNKSYYKTSVSVGSPLESLGFNPVQGYHANVDVNFLKYFDEHNTRWLRISPLIQYGFSDKKWRGSLSLDYNFSGETFSYLRLEAGINTVTQYNQLNPISTFLNTYYSLYAKRNYMRIYERNFAKLFYRRELTNGLLFRTSIEYAQRYNNLVNTTQHSWFRKDSIYQTNIPDHPTAIGEEVYKDEAIFVDVAFRIRFDQKYISYPDQKFIMGSRYPDIWLSYRKGFGDVDFDFVSMSVKDNMELGLFGLTEWSVNAGWYIRSNQMRFIDYKFFNGNQTIIFTPDKMLNAFYLLPYYEYSTNDWFTQAHLQHHFNGFILDKLPLLRKLNWQSVLSAHYLYTPEFGHYTELAYGFDNIGFGAFRIFRVDAVASFSDLKYKRFGVRLGVKL